MIRNVPHRTVREGSASKGSRYCLQRYVEQRPQELGELIVRSSPLLAARQGTEVSWLSPLAEQNYLEYRDDFLGPKALNLPDYFRALKDFWPDNRPQWDGLALLRSTDGPAVLLIEAKAYPGETRSSCSAKNPVSIERIRTRLAELQSYMGVAPADWMTGAYQLANRLAFLYFLHVLCEVPSFFVLINFVDDQSYKPTGYETWLPYPWTAALGISDGCRLADRVLTVYPEAL